MSQTSIIFGTLLVSFIVFITIKGQLPQWAGLFYGDADTNAPAPTQSSSSSGSSGSSSGGIGSDISAVAGIAALL